MSTQTAICMQTPVGQIPINPWTADRVALMSDRQVVDELFNGKTSALNPELVAVVMHRRLNRQGNTKAAIYQEVEQREGATA